MNIEKNNDKPDLSKKKHSLKCFKKIFWRGCLLLFIVFSVLFGVLIWCSSSEDGFAWLISQACKFSNNTLSIKQVNGTLWQGFSLKDVQLKTGSNQIKFDNINLTWRPKQLLSKQLDITKLDLGNIKILENKNHSESNQSISMPNSLELPVNIQVDRLSIHSLSLNNKYALYQSVINYKYAKEKHQLIIKKLNSPWGNINGKSSISDKKPFNISSTTNIQLDMKDSFAKGSGVINISGNLYKSQINAQYADNNLTIKLNTHLTPFAEPILSKLKDINLYVHKFNPYALDKKLPKGEFDLSIFMAPSNKNDLHGNITITNSKPGKIQDKYIPLKNLAGDFILDNGELRSNNLLINLIDGKINISGKISNKNVSLASKLNQISLNDLSVPLPKQHLSGSIVATGSPNNPNFKIDISTEKLKLNSDLYIKQQANNTKLIKIKNLNLSAKNSGVIQTAGNITLGKTQEINLITKLLNANPKGFFDKAPNGVINATWSLNAKIAKTRQIKTDLTFGNSQINGTPLIGKIHVELNNNRLLNINANLHLAQNTLNAFGAFGNKDDKLIANINATDLSIIGAGFSGKILAKLVLSGNIKNPILDSSANIDNLHIPNEITIKKINLSGNIKKDINSPINIIINAQDIQKNALNIGQVNFKLNGSRANHQIISNALFSIKNHSYKFNLLASGHQIINQPYIAWTGKINQFAITGEYGLTLISPLNIQASERNIQISSADFNLLGGILKINKFSWEKGKSIISSGNASNISLLALNTWFPILSGQSLIFDTNWNIDIGKHINNATINITRRSGDLVIPSSNGEKIALGLSNLQAQLKALDGRSDFKIDVTSRFAKLKTTGSFNNANQFPNLSTPINARLQAEVPSFSALKPFLPIGLDVSGKMLANITMQGSLINRNLSGTINAEQLAIYDSTTGVKLENGSLKMHLDGQNILLDQLQFISQQKKHTGKVTASGTLNIQGDIPTVNADVNFDKFSVFSKPGRKLIVSGSSKLGISSSKGIVLQGKLTVDFGRIDLPKNMQPSLSEDVIVVGTTPPEKSALEKLPVTIELQLDLGNKFRFAGEGLSVDLGGNLTIKTNPGLAPSANGQVNIIQGRYKAYGQDLDIKKGAITFNGPLDNPTLNIRAERRMSPVGAGVTVTGSVSQPIVKLVANEAMTDKEILAWLVLGRSSSGSQDNDALAIAAGSFLAGSINNKIGLFDDIGIQNKQERYGSGGQVSPAEQVITVGKQLSKNIYVGYEYSISSTNQAVKMVYQFSKIWSFVLRVGQDSSNAEARFTYRFD